MAFLTRIQDVLDATDVMLMNSVKVAIVGASGYSGEELVRLLLRHPGAALTSITSRQNAGKSLAEVFPKFASVALAKSLRFVLPDPAELARQAEVIFLALPHGVAAEMAVPLLKAGRRVIDLSADFRLKSAAVYQEYYGHPHPAPEYLSQAVYGLPEVYREAIKKAVLVASPGCYPTSILLPVLPLIRAGLIKPASIIANSLSGVSGAGRKAEIDYLFAECNESMRAYGLLKHRHLSEIEQELSLASGHTVVIQFTPHLIPVNRGMFTTLYLAPARELNSTAALEQYGAQISQCYHTAYGGEPFVRLLTGSALPDSKNVTGTNQLEMAWRVDPRTGRLLVLSAQDNLTKGASGQAVQSFNLMADLPETTGLE